VQATTGLRKCRHKRQEGSLARSRAFERGERCKCNIGISARARPAMHMHGPGRVRLPQTCHAGMGTGGGGVGLRQLLKSCCNQTALNPRADRWDTWTGTGDASGHGHRRGGPWSWRSEDGNAHYAGLTASFGSSRASARGVKRHWKTGAVAAAAAASFRRILALLLLPCPRQRHV